MDNRSKIVILGVLLVACLGLTARFAVSLMVEMQTNRQGVEFYSALPVKFEQMPVPTEEPCLAISPEISETIGETETLEAIDAIEPRMDFDEMREKFPSIVGWIQSEGTPINYPIMQGSDNDFYLHHLPDQVPHAWGSIFLDYRNDFSGDCILIYGHSMRSGDMFGSLRQYANPGFFEAHPCMFIFTPERDFILQIFAGYVIDSAFEMPPMRFEDESSFCEFVADIRSRSVFSCDATPTFGDSIVFLATCTDSANTNERLIIAGYLQKM